MSKDTDDMANQRTKWAEDRTLMANERTFSSWMGTGLGAIGVAIGLKAVFGAFEPTWAAKMVATIFLLAAIAIFWSARKQALKTFDRLTDNDANAQPSRSYTGLAAIMTAATVATGAILWSL
jgi:putative membrane protein